MGQWETRSPTGTPLFAAANSGKGFVSFYEDVFNRSGIERRYLLKGGPGTGKSHVLRCVADHARADGRTVESYCCSSDPDSLDGIVIDGKIAVLDGTAPHLVDAELPGARDELIDLGAFWNTAALAVRVGEIASLNEKKSACYRRAYRFLSACDELYAVNRSLILPSVKHEKLQNAVLRRLATIPRGKGGSILPGLSDSIGMKGSVHFDTYEQWAKHLYVIEDVHETATLFLRALLTGGLQQECPMRVSYHPIHVGEPDAVYFCDTGDCFVIAREDGDAQTGSTHINMKRFVDAEAVRAVRSKLRMNRRLYDAMLTAAEDALSEVGTHHFALEAIYSQCMDYEAENRFLRSFCANL